MKNNFLDFLSEIKNCGNKIVVIEQTFNWDEYYNNPNSIDVPIYHINEYALQKYEVEEINKFGLVVGLERNSKRCHGLIPYKKFIGFVDDYGNGSLIALFDFKNESLFQKVWEI